MNTEITNRRDVRFTRPAAAQAPAVGARSWTAPWRRITARPCARCSAPTGWTRVFIHYRIDPAVLQPHVPFELDLYDGARVRHPRRLHAAEPAARPRRPPRRRPEPRPSAATSSSTSAPTCATGGEPGIYFIAEWIPNRLAALLGPPSTACPSASAGSRTYTTPAAVAETAWHAPCCVRAHGVTRDIGDAAFEARATSTSPTPPRGLDEFLVERYTAYTSAGAGSNPSAPPLPHRPRPLAAGPPRTCG